MESKPEPLPTTRPFAEPVKLTSGPPGDNDVTSHVDRRDIFKRNRSAALAEWRQLAA
jgi:hypothetical protein